MNRWKILIVVVGLCLLVPIALLVAQGDKMGAVKDSVSGKMKQATATAGKSDVVGQMTASCQAMTDDFAKLRAHFDKMMQLADMAALKTEMQKHQQMMTDFDKKLADHQKMCMGRMSGVKSEAAKQEQVIKKKTDTEGKKKTE